MIKKGTIALFCLAAVLVGILSWAASIWQLQTRLSNAGGTIKVRNNATQTTVATTVFTNFTTSAPVPVTVAASPGYKISSLLKNNSSIVIGNFTSHYNTTFLKSSGTTQSLVAGFTAQQISVTGTAVGPGTITPTSATVPSGSTLVLTATPSNTGSFLTGVTGGTVADLLGNPVTYPFAGTVKITVTNVTSSKTVTANFTTYGADAGASQLGAVGIPITLKGSLVGGGTPSWSQTGGPVTALAGATTLTPSFNPGAVGTYQFLLTELVGGISVASATTQVNVVASLADVMRINCMGCHGAAGVLPAPNTFTGWSSSTHKVVGISCVSCHTSPEMPTNVYSGNVDSTTFSYKDGSGSYCLNGSCHAPGLVHKTPGMTCANCHGDYKNHNPNRTFSQVTGACSSCHGGVNTTHYYTFSSLTGTQCPQCHNQTGHNPLPFAFVPREHFNGYTSYANPSYAGAYVTPTTLCSDCHQGGDPTAAGDTAIKQYRTDWAASGHGDRMGAPWLNSASHNWKASGTAGANAKASASIATDCQRCHTATGYLQFAQYTTFNPIAPSTAKYSEPLTCNACHTGGDFSTPRSIPPRTGYYNYSSALTGRLAVSSVYPDSGRSNICLGCHVGRAAGATITAIATATAHKSYSTSVWQNLSFVNSHYLTAGGQVFGTTGYEYPGQNYKNGVNHSLVGTDTAEGPCAACHMPGNSHTLNPAGAGYALCNGCHQGAGTVNASFVSQKSADYVAGLKALGAALTQDGFPPILDADGIPKYPYFSNKNWGNQATAPGNMGAAFNYNLLAHDPGAFAHNPTYSKRLVRDSIDYLVNGSIDRSRDLTTTINALLTSTTDENNANAFLQYANNGSSACAVCHSDTLDPLTGNNIVATYNASPHAKALGGATCSSCHVPVTGSVDAHPPTLNMPKATADINVKCSGCHAVHPWPSLGICTNCHNGHDPTPILPPPHLGNYSSAQYFTGNISCLNCHYAVDDPSTPTVKSFNIFDANREWARAGKANPKSVAYISNDFKLLGNTATPATSSAQDCVRCHTTTGYINYVSSGFTDVHAWGTDANLPPGESRKREMISCPACHNPTPFNSFDSAAVDDLGLPVQPAFSRRVVPAVTAYYNYSGPALRLLNSVPLTDLGVSNNCVACHSGTLAGTTIKMIAGYVGGTSASFWDSTPFIGTHGMGAAGILFAKTGYQYQTRTYATGSVIHDALDDADSGGQGACVACHLYTDRPHLFTPISSASNGAITKVRAFDQVCWECHGGIQPINLDTNPENLDAKKQGFISSLKAVSALLAGKGIYFNPALAPYFFNVSDPAQQGPASSYYTAWNALNGGGGINSGETLMGAAFNLRLLWSDVGAYVHNSVYTKKLIFDTIDFLDNGVLNGTTATITISGFPTKVSPVGVTINNLPLTASFTAADKTRALTYVGGARRP